MNISEEFTVFNPITYQAIQMLIEERNRVIHSEGFNHDHDKSYLHDELIKAALCYIGGPILNQNEFKLIARNQLAIPIKWPFDPEWYKPTDSRIRELIKGLQFGLAELERLLIAEQQKP